MTKKKESKMSNSFFSEARVNKKDEFYTRLVDIENELSHYKDHFKNKIIYCNCDDPYRSNFVKYFALNFKFLGLKQLVATCYKHPDVDDSNFENVSDRPIKWVYNGEQIEGQNYPDFSKANVIELKGDGDFRSEECLDVLKECDIVVTNPPFSLFRDFIAVMKNYKKKFIIIGNQNAITYNETFPLFMNNEIWYGINTNKSMFFEVPDDYYLSKNSVIKEDKKYVKVPAIAWFTNLEHDKRNEEIILFKKYNKEEYPKYDNYDIINVDKVKEIPCDYTGLMGVPITVMCKYNPKQFEIVGLANNARWINHECYTIINGIKKYNRIILRNRKPQID